MIIYVYGFKDLTIAVTFKFEMFTNDNATNISLIVPFACFCTDVAKDSLTPFMHLYFKHN